MTRFSGGMGSTQSHGRRGGLAKSRRPPEGKVEAIGAGQLVAALGQGMDAMKPQAIRPAPDHHVAVDQRIATDITQPPGVTMCRNGETGLSRRWLPSA